MQPRFPPPGGPPQHPGMPAVSLPLPPPPGYNPYHPPYMPGYPPRPMMPPAGAMPGFPMMPGFNPYGGMHPMHMVPGAVPGYPPRPPSLQLPPFPPVALPSPTAASIAAPPVIIGAPMLKSTVPPAPPALSSAAPLSASNINLFNNNNANSAFVNPTSDILNRTIFVNAMAGLPLTVCCGNIPPDFEDSKLAKIFESCGKVSKMVRPIDPVTSIPASFAFVSYFQAICALRAVNLIHGLDLMNGRGSKLVVKTGSKESAMVRSVQATEQEAVTTLPEGHSLEDVYGPIRAAIERILVPAIAASTTEQIVADEEELKRKINEGMSDEQRPVSYYESLLSMNAAHADKALHGDHSARPSSLVELSGTMAAEAGEVTDSKDDGHGGPVPEHFLQSEIDRFRQRQVIREKELAAAKKDRVMARLRQLQTLAAKQEAEMALSIADSADSADASAMDAADKQRQQPPPPPTATSFSKRPLEPDYDELEAKRRRKLEVLHMLSETENVTVSDAVISRGFKLVSSVNKGGFKATSAWEEEDDEQHTRKLTHLLEEGEEEEEKEKKGIDKNRVGEDGLVLHPFEEVDDEDYGDLVDQDVGVKGARNNKKKNQLVMPKPKPPVVAPPPQTGLPQEVQQRVLAQAMAISAALSNKAQTAPPPLIPAPVSAPPVPAPVQKLDPKEALRQLVLKIPTEPAVLLAQPVNWSLLHAQKIIATQLRDWIGQKVVEYLGDDEEATSTLSGFIAQKLSHSNGCSPAELRQELAMVLEDDAEAFVLKLWRMLVFYSLKCEQGLQMSCLAT